MPKPHFDGAPDLCERMRKLYDRHTPEEERMDGIDFVIATAVLAVFACVVGFCSWVFTLVLGWGDLAQRERRELVDVKPFKTFTR